MYQNLVRSVARLHQNKQDSILFPFSSAMNQYQYSLSIQLQIDSLHYCLTMLQKKKLFPYLYSIFLKAGMAFPYIGTGLRYLRKFQKQHKHLVEM